MPVRGTRYDIEKISADKAANPTNVLGSRGSVLSVFNAQIANGGQVTVTHPEITRYFMTIPEAVLLVLQASVVGRGGEVLILDMGEPIRIADVAQRLIRHSGRHIEIVYTGLSDGEKLHEDLLSIGEDGTRPFHPKITHVPVVPLRPRRPHNPVSTFTGEAHTSRQPELRATRATPP